jgi:hypothetical protein
MIMLDKHDLAARIGKSVYVVAVAVILIAIYGAVHAVGGAP